MNIFTLVFFLICVMLPSAAFAAPVIVPVLGLTGVAAAVAGLAINIALSYVVNKLFQPEAPTGPMALPDPGVRQRIASDTANKLPVVYGESRMRGSTIFADIRDDNQRMAFIIALSCLLYTSPSPRD